MSTYTVSKVLGQICVHCDGVPIELGACVTECEPLYDFGRRSDGCVNLAYVILAHCCGEGEAEQLCEDAAAKFLQDKIDVPFDLQDDEIQKFVDGRNANLFKAQETVRDMKEIKPFGG